MNKDSLTATVDLPTTGRRQEKIPPPLRRTAPVAQPRSTRTRLGRIALRLRIDSQFLRTAVQASFVLLCVWIGLEFYLFMRWGLSGGTEAFVARPPGAEGFLPISSLISLKYWLQTGVITTIHPSGLFILLGILGTGVFLKKAFCSWLCPLGTLSESLWMLGKKMFGKNIRVPGWVDYPLRSLKYLLLLFFLWSVMQMDIPSMKGFIGSPYNKIADIKMYMFFAQIGTFALWTIIILVLLSVLVKNIWCRYLCPYGALLGIVSTVSPLKITRDASRCIDCELCTKSCPASILVHKAGKVRSDECSMCLQCVEVCPVKETLEIRSAFARRRIPNVVFGALVVGVFAAITGPAILTGHWQNSISKEEYLRRIQAMESPLYQHFRGKVPDYGPND